MKNLLLLLIVIMPCYLTAQLSTSKKNGVHIIGGMSVGGGINSHQGFDETQMSFPDHIDQYLKSQGPALNYRFGIGYQRMVLPNLSLKTGVLFSSWNLRFQDLDKQELLLQNWYVEIPLLAQYSLGQNKFRPYVEGGVNLMMRVVYSDYSTPMSIAAQLGIGVSHELSETISLYAQLSGRAHVIESINYHRENINGLWTAVYTYPYEVGLDIGASYSF